MTDTTAPDSTGKDITAAFDGDATAIADAVLPQPKTKRSPRAATAGEQRSPREILDEAKAKYTAAREQWEAAELEFRAARYAFAKQIEVPSK